MILGKKVTPYFSIGLGIFMVAMIIIYGFLTTYFNQSIYSNGNMNYGRALGRSSLLIMDTVFTLLGFGLLISPYKNAKWSGLAISLFVVSFNIILGLLFQDMFFQIFFGFRSDSVGGNGLTAAPNAYQFWNRHSQYKKSTASFYSFRLSNLCSTSYLIGMTAFSGRIHIQKIALSLPIFAFLFYLNFYLNSLVSYSDSKKNDVFNYLDSYGTILVYLFGGIYGIIVGAITNKKNSQTQSKLKLKSRFSIMLSLLGSFFLFATFIQSFTGVVTGYFNSKQQNFRLNAGAIHVTFGLIGGIIGNYVSSLLAGNGRMNVNNIIIGTISGGIIIGGLADIIENIGVSSFLGFIAGVIGGLYMTFIHSKLKAKHNFDQQGLLGSVLIVSFLASFVIHPSILSQYYIRRKYLRGTGQILDDNHVARYHLAYFAITLGISAFCGLFLGLIYNIKRSLNDNDYQDIKFFAQDYGLYNYTLKLKQINQKNNLESAQNLKQVCE